MIAVRWAIGLLVLLVASDAFAFHLPDTSFTTPWQDVVSRFGETDRVHLIRVSVGLSGSSEQKLDHLAARSQSCTSDLSLRAFGHRDVIATEASKHLPFEPSVAPRLRAEW